ncbi:hypothetical protein MPL1032_220010 [Mesorhizobium plurifarium]|uniref:Uncharacterized protein n=1 Tax=Mesorhizobium plurifarium TaxID=69974 RepID=A0A0K2VZE3_MESPL|nr:hypothetical protein MPL1032_220010 [Mesorhizobium plurifarium]
MTPSSVRKAVIAWVEKTYPKITVVEGTDFVSLYETPGDHETAVSMSFSQTGPLMRRMRKAAQKTPIRKTVVKTRRRKTK